jgi:hypothetical protein
MRISSVLTSFRFSDFPYGESIALFSCVDDQGKENDNQRDSTKDRVDGSEPAPIRSHAKRTKYMLSLTRNSLSNWTRTDLHAGISRPLEPLFSPIESGAGLVFGNFAIVTPERVGASLTQEFVIGRFTKRRGHME